MREVASGVGPYCSYLVMSQRIQAHEQDGKASIESSCARPRDGGERDGTGQLVEGERLKEQNNPFADGLRFAAQCVTSFARLTQREAVPDISNCNGKQHMST